MKHLLFLLPIFIILNTNSNTFQIPSEQLINAKKVYVYVCDSRTSIAYHSSKNCRGLSRCTHKVILVTISEARNVYRKRACKICY